MLARAFSLLILLQPTCYLFLTDKSEESTTRFIYILLHKQAVLVFTNILHIILGCLVTPFPLPK